MAVTIIYELYEKVAKEIAMEGGAAGLMQQALQQQ